MVTKLGEELLYEDVTYKIRGACFKVWKEFGGAFKEKIIDNALSEELFGQGLKIESQKRIDIYYGDKKVGIYIPDKIVNDAILLELKCKPFLTKEDERQFWLYLKGSNYKVGLLVNFGSKKLEIRRRIYDKARKIPRSSA
ncbi:MAG: GxxExxY protein [Candidatus Portnoybacteria bacterium]|nr:GxxExxY protein [Candidatus Portnoybacteria bacterium]